MVFVTRKPYLAYHVTGISQAAERMNEQQEQYLYLANHKIESADEMLDHHAQIKDSNKESSRKKRMQNFRRNWSITEIVS